MSDIHSVGADVALGRLAQAAGANCSYLTCDQVYVHWQVHGNGGSVYEYKSNWGQTPMVEWVSGPQVNANGQLDYEP